MQMWLNATRQTNDRGLDKLLGLAQGSRTDYFAFAPSLLDFVSSKVRELAELAPYSVLQPNSPDIDGISTYPKKPRGALILKTRMEFSSGPYFRDTSYYILRYTVPVRSLLRGEGRQTSKNRYNGMSSFRLDDRDTLRDLKFRPRTLSDTLA